MIGPQATSVIRNPQSAIRISVCRVCGTELRRAVDDVVRCPRCKCFQVRSLPDDPAYRLVGRHRWVRFLPYLCIFLFWFAVVVTFRVLSRSPGWAIPTAAMTGAAWLAAVAAFRRACDAVPGWPVSLFEFHLGSAILLVSSYQLLKTAQAVDAAGWSALLGARPILAGCGVILAMAVSIDAIRRGDSIRLRPYTPEMWAAESRTNGAAQEPPNID